MHGELIKILLVEDDEDDYIITRDLLSEVNGHNYKVDWSATFDAALETMMNNDHDVYLCNYRLGERTGVELLHEAVKNGCKAPIILLTGQRDMEKDLEAMKAGASDYLIKSEVNSHLLERSIRYAIERKHTSEKISRIAYYDSLTELPNRVLFQDRMNQAIEQAKRYSRKAAILFLDLDNFKRINDTLEHRMGDLLLKLVADRLNSSIRTTDTVTRHEAGEPATAARLGGDEFTVLLTEINCSENAAKVAHRFLGTLDRPFQLGSHEVFVTASIGIAIYPDDGEDMNSLLKNADTAMYFAKEKGKNNFQFYKHSMNDTALEKLTLENDLRKAVERNELLLYYQPQIDIITREITGMEALIRWQHPDKGMISPAEFIPLAEETGLIITLGEWVLKTACKQIKSWENSGLPPVRVAVNLSGRQFQQEGLIKTIKEILEDSSLDPQYLELEFTESIMMKNVESTISVLHELKEMGMRLSMDDFGTGYSSFSYLKRFPLDVIKIDHAFIKDVTENPDDASIVSAIIAMSHTLKLTVIAECVETEEQLEFLREHECDQMQGYLLSAPLPANEAAEFLEKARSQLSPAR